jgi:hypothetical protein
MTSDHIEQGETIVEVGAEGGSISLRGRRDEQGEWRFRVITNEAALSDLIGEEPTPMENQPWVDSWDDALTLLGRFPWPRLHPIAVHHEFVDDVLAAISSHKDGGPTEVRRWRDWLVASRSASAKRPWGAMNEIRPADGLHRIKDRFQKTYMAIQCEILLKGLDEAIDATLKAAPVRQQGYLVDHSGAKSPRLPEGALERRIFERWSADACDAVPGCWNRIVAFQTNLPGSREDKGWGEVDLLGLADDGLPIVIELKQEEAGDTPAKIIVQAVAYGLALQKAWYRLREEWRQATAKHIAASTVLPTSLHPLRVVCAAPQAYWDLWLGDSPTARTVPDGAWVALNRLLEAFKKRGIFITAAAVLTDTELTIAPFRHDFMPSLS